MKDPLPSNITGEKTVSHVVEHTVRWDYLALAAAALYVAWKVAGAFDTEEIEEEIEGNNQVPALGTER